MVDQTQRKMKEVATTWDFEEDDVFVVNLLGAMVSEPGGLFFWGLCLKSVVVFLGVILLFTHLLLLVPYDP